MELGTVDLVVHGDLHRSLWNTLKEGKKGSNAAEHFDFVHFYLHSNNRQIKLKCMEKTILTFDHVCLLADFYSH